jgi:colanic acid biosynthesis glycosyl transferase WcaI
MERESKERKALSINAHAGDARAPRTRPKPRLLVLNQYYWPGVEATARMLTQLCEALATEYDITVISGTTSGAEKPGRTQRAGVEIVRVPSTAFERSRRSLRALNYISYLLFAAIAGSRKSKPAVVLCMTDPPFIAIAAYVVARRFRVPLVVVSQDVFPESAVGLGLLKNRVLEAFLQQVTSFPLKRASNVVAIGETMQRRLMAKGVRPERIAVIPNWADSRRLHPEPRDNAWARKHGLTDRFVVMHSGNIGYAQNLDALVHAAWHLRELEQVAFVIIGGGSRLNHLTDLSRTIGATSVGFLPYQPEDMLPMSLSSADIHVVGLAPGLSGYVVPSRLYGIMAVGRPVIVAAEEDGETAQLVKRVDCGVVIPPGNARILADTIKDAHDGKFDLAAMGERARVYAVSEANREVAASRYASLLRAVAAS